MTGASCQSTDLVPLSGKNELEPRQHRNSRTLNMFFCKTLQKSSLSLLFLYFGSTVNLVAVELLLLFYFTSAFFIIIQAGSAEDGP